MGVLTYLRNPWNAFDALVTALSVVGVLVENLMQDSAAFLPVLRILRLVRIFKLVPRARGLRTLLRTVYWWVSLHALLVTLNPNPSLVLTELLQGWVVAGASTFL